MRFTPTSIDGVVIVDADVFADDRGAFIRTWMPEEFQAHGLDTRIAQCSMAFNKKRGTIRGLHYQESPFQEVKVVRAVAGAIFDVAVDLRRDSPTFCQWIGVELTSHNRRSLYIAPGLAHGYQTLTDDAEVFYLVSAPYSPPHQRGVRWNDAAFGIKWPLGTPSIIHERDATYRDFSR